MSFKSLIEQSWSILLENIDTVATDTGKKCHRMMQAYDQESVSEQKFEDYRKMFDDFLKKYNDMQDMDDLKIDRYSCYFWDLENKETSTKMTIVLGNEIDWKHATDDEKARDFEIIDKFVKTLDQTTINLKKLKNHDNEDRPHARIEFELEDEDDERGISKVISKGKRAISKAMSRKKNGNQERSNSETSSDAVEKKESENHGMGLEDKFDKDKGMGLGSKSDKSKREKDRKEKKEKQKKINRDLFLESKKERDEEEERKRRERESKNKSNVETQEEPEQDDGLEM